MGERVFLMGHKALCLTSSGGLLALMLILPRFHCAVHNVKTRDNSFCRNFSFPKQVCCVPTSCVPLQQPYLNSLAGLLGGLEPFDGRRYLIISGVMFPELPT